MRAPATTMIAALAAWACASEANVRVCTTTAGAPLYTQFDCPLGTVPSKHDPGGALSIVTGAGLSEGERRALAALDAELNRKRSARRDSVARRANASRERRSVAQARCEEAEAALAGLQAVRRKGYGAAEGRRLTMERERWRRIRKSNC